MAKPTTKAELIQAATESYQELCGLIASLTERELAASFDFTKMKSKKASFLDFIFVKSKEAATSLSVREAVSPHNS